MKDKNKSIRNLTIGAVTGGILLGGFTLVLSNNKPFIRDNIESYQVITDTTISTTDSCIKLKPTTEYMTRDETRDLNELEIKSYTLSKDKYEVNVYGFTKGRLAQEEIITKQKQFESGNSLSAINNYDNYDEYQVETRELPSSYKNILEEINIKTVNYDDVIMVRESSKSNAKYTTLWLGSIFIGSIAGFAFGSLDYSKIKRLRK